MSMNFLRQIFLIALLLTWRLAIIADCAGLCWERRANLTENDFVPDCTDDGNFKPIQCDSKTRYCFCVDPFTGKPEHTSTRLNLLKCNRKNYRLQHHNNDDTQNRQQYDQPVASSLTSFDMAPDKNKRRQRKRCVKEQRIAYVNKLVTSITNQNHRRQNPLGITIGMIKPTAGTLLKKFKELDLDKDDFLSSKEMRKIDEHPSFTSCANSMFDFCDQNHDLIVEWNEFDRCLDTKNTPEMNDIYVLWKRERRLERNRNRQQNRKLDIQSLSESQLGNNSRKNKKKEPRLDCLVIRKNLIESSLFNSKTRVVFIPECTADGHYVRVQCTTPYCWCVSNVTGHPIKRLNNNSTENQEACDLMRKDCDQRRRKKFHEQFRRKLATKGQNCDSVYDEIDFRQDQSIDDQEFQKYMKNSNSFDMGHRLKKCVRTEVYYCDQNDDGLLTRQEWIQCCNDNISSSFNLLTNSFPPLTLGNGFLDSSSSSSPSSSSLLEAFNQKKNRVRTGSNPLKILQSE